MYAVIETGGKQYQVEEGTVLEHERLNGVDAGDSVEFDKVLLLVDGETVRVGTPYLDDVKVKAEIRDHFRGDKVIVFKYKSKKGYRRKQGHRQELTTTVITAIEG